MALANSDPRHGTSNGYINLGCRCQPCRDAHAAKHREYMRTHPEQREKARLRELASRGRPPAPRKQSDWRLGLDKKAATLKKARELSLTLTLLLEELNAL